MKKGLLVWTCIAILIAVGCSHSSDAPGDFTDVRSLGDSSSAIKIWNWYDLDAVRTNLSGSYVLMTNLDSTTAGYTELASPTANGGAGWYPIGTVSTPFSGNFNGQGYEIRNMFINGGSFVGLFGVLGASSVITNLGVVNATVTAGSFAGALAGQKWGIVTNCYATGTVSGTEDVIGGLIGQTGGPAMVTMSNCYFIGSVTGDENVGGLVGNTWQSILSNSYSGGTVNGNWMVGGLVGYGAGWGITNCYSTASVSGGFCIGGLIGQMVGGIVRNCYALGAVTGGHNVGGLIGRVAFGNDDGYVSNSYSAGRVSGSSNVGGLIGSNEWRVHSCFWDTRTSGQSISAAGIGKTTAEMKDISTFKNAGWAIKTTSLGNPTGGYPFLSWQLSGSTIWLIYEEIPAGCVATTTDTGVACFTTSNGTIEYITAVPTPPGAPAKFPHGMFTFKITGVRNREEVTLTVQLPGPVPTGTKWWKYHNNTWFPMDIGDDDGDNVIMVMLKDGGVGDADGRENGEIIDDGGPGYLGAVGWETYPINKMRLLLPWIVSVTAIIASLSLLFLWRRGRGLQNP